ncbi:LysM peptidoglycan-binding domain-containing protein [Listeria sp. FSL L7-1582]|nr:LysM peptidoglycan-binding domain-containing protein [Listeria portnoyi]
MFIDKELAIENKGILQYYTIRPDDNLSTIAKRYGQSVIQLQSWNNIENANKIVSGQKIRVK